MVGGIERVRREGNGARAVGGKFRQIGTEQEGEKWGVVGVPTVTSFFVVGPQSPDFIN